MKIVVRTGWMILGGLTLATATFAAEAFQIDPVHSSVMFRVKHMNASYAYGRFNEVTGKFLIDEQDATKSTFDLTINAETIDTASAQRDTHLKGPDFFNAKQFPTIKFKSKSVSKGPQGYVASGDLTVKGVTKPIEVAITPVGTAKNRGASIAGLEATLELKRSDFGMTYMVGPIGDEVKVTVSLEGSRK